MARLVNTPLRTMDPYSPPHLIRRRLARERREKLLLRWAFVSIGLVSIIAAFKLGA